jgi:hypothetical protein
MWPRVAWIIQLGGVGSHQAFEVPAATQADYSSRRVRCARFLVRLSSPKFGSHPTVRVARVELNVQVNFSQNGRWAVPWWSRIGDRQHKLGGIMPPITATWGGQTADVTGGSRSSGCVGYYPDWPSRPGTVLIVVSTGGYKNCQSFSDRCASPRIRTVCPGPSSL